MILLIASKFELSIAFDAERLDCDKERTPRYFYHNTLPSLSGRAKRAGHSNGFVQDKQACDRIASKRESQRILDDPLPWFLTSYHSRLAASTAYSPATKDCSPSCKTYFGQFLRYPDVVGGVEGPSQEASRRPGLGYYHGLETKATPPPV